MLRNSRATSQTTFSLFLTACGSFAFGALASVPAAAQKPAADSVARAKECPSCAEWNAPHAPFRVFGNTYYVGTRGLSAILITSSNGLVLIDGGLPESAPQIMASIVALGYRVADVKVILNSHDHFDHAGGIDALQRASGAKVIASPLSAPVLRTGKSRPDDPQYAIALPFPAVSRVSTVNDGDTVRVGSLALAAHFTPGHTPGGTTWSWQSCEGRQCVNMVYADSQTPVSADDFYFTRSTTYPNGVSDFQRSFLVLESLKCDVLLTPHPDASGIWSRLASRDAGNGAAMIDDSACKRYAATARTKLTARLAKERQQR